MTLDISICFQNPMGNAVAVMPIPATRSRQYSRMGGYLSAAALPTDSVGNYNLTLTNLVVGSVVQVERFSTGDVVENRIAAGTPELFVVPAYGTGSPLNDLRIKVRKGTSAPYYQPYETQATAVVGSQSVFIAQTPDE